MKRLLVAIVALVLCAGSFGLGRASTANFDASFWSGLSDESRLHFVQGVTDGASLGFVQGYIDGANAAFAKADDDVTVVEQTGDVIPIPELVAAMRKRLGAQKLQVMKDMLSLKTTPPVFDESFQTYITSVTRYYAANPSKTGDSPAAIMLHFNQK